MIGAVVICGLVGLAFAPVAGRVRGIYLGVATLSLVFLGLWLGQSLGILTGGTGSGGPPPTFTLFGFPFTNPTRARRSLGVAIQKQQRLWYLFLAFAADGLRAGPGRRARPDRPGVAGGARQRGRRRGDGRVRAAGQGRARSRSRRPTPGSPGVMTVLWFGLLKPDESEFTGNYRITVAIAFLAMIIIGGLGSVAGAVVGAMLVYGLQQFFLLGANRVRLVRRRRVRRAVAPVIFAAFIYGLAVVLVVLFEPGGRPRSAAGCPPLVHADSTREGDNDDPRAQPEALSRGRAGAAARGAAAAPPTPARARPARAGQDRQGRDRRRRSRSGIMGDTSGVFKNLGAAINAGNQLWVDDVNGKGGICNRQLKLEIVDHGYKADTAKTLYPQLEPKVLGIVQLLGSPVLAALKQNLIDDNSDRRARVLVEPDPQQPEHHDDRHDLRPGDHQRAGLPAAAGR